MTYKTADDDLAVASGGDSRGSGCSNLGGTRSLGLLGDTASRSSGGGSSLDGSGATRATAATGAGGLGVLHDLVERLVELSLSRHVDNKWWFRRSWSIGEVRAKLMRSLVEVDDLLRKAKVRA